MVVVSDTPSSLVFKITAPVRAMPVSFFFIVPNKSRPPHAGGGLPTGPLPALHPFWVGRASVGIFTPHQRERRGEKKVLESEAWRRKAWVEAERISASESRNHAITASRHCVMRKDK
ncbi:hypothetical protein AVEN_219828-1 [Araneus ventricosus]|nr:hypothetical protein AVEN_264178-1 [Araneus ventricosus]GBM46486.1 hypothetical protein AVEN_40429-1 [Araneus ventricosus]GBM46510.1 hypothetical protein AVEN_219828-1 [Araneus ventricosus]